MPLTPGTKLGPYEVVGALGAGGMGEVYRARDTRLERTVAVKVLSAHLSDKPEARERFDREARAISSLSHPNICHLYDVGEQNSIRYLVMEYLEGETLADRLRKGPLPLEQLFKIAIEICDGLEKAHRSGVVHRDLKPSNIMLTKAGAKLMDFGLAKPTAAAVGASSSSHSVATLTAQPLTAEGSIIGTYQYMSPEQVEGKEADARSDIFALGVVLYEMATGKRAFEGKTTASTIANILAAEPKPISAIQPMTPVALEHLVKTCLAKDPDERSQTAHDVKLQLQWIAQSGSQISTTPAARPARNHTAWVAAGVFALAAIAIGISWWVSAHQPKPTMYFSSVFPAQANDVTLSPDGEKVAVVAYSDQVNKYIIWLHDIGSRSATGLPGTEDASHPFWSPDGKFIAFFSQGKLKKIDLASSNVQVICNAPHGRGGTWNKDGIIVFAPDVWVGLHRVSEGGGTPVEITRPDGSKQEMSHRWPVFLPDGKHFIYLAANFAGGYDKNSLYVGALDSSEKKFVSPATSNAAYVGGYLIFQRDNGLFAQKFDLSNFSLNGDAHALAGDVQYFPQIDLSTFSVAGNGTLVLQTGRGYAKSQLTWFDRSGKEVGMVGPQGVFADPAIAPDGRHIAFGEMQGAGEDIFIRESGSDALLRLTFGPGLNELPQWSRDGKRILFMANEKLGSGLHIRNADGSGAEVEIASPAEYLQSSGREAWSWSPDGEYVLVAHNGSLSYIDLQKRDEKPLIQGNIRNAQFSPDGKWIAYSSNESGGWEIYVSPFPAVGSKWQVSRGGGQEPRWRHDGKELFYLSPEGKMMTVPVTLGTNFESGTPVALFQTHVRQPISSGDVVSYDVSADGQRFLINKAIDEGNAPLTVVLSWASQMGK